MTQESEDNPDSEEPKLIIDDDWKTQVQKEKDELEKKEAAGSSKDSAAGSSPDSSDDTLPPPPEASFEMLVTMLASQALVSSGQVPSPATGKPEPNKAYMRHYIDTISMLEEKTKGNLSSEEETALTQTLHQLRMLFLSVKDA